MSIWNKDTTASSSISVNWSTIKSLKCLSFFLLVLGFVAVVVFSLYVASLANLFTKQARSSIYRASFKLSLISFWFPADANNAPFMKKSRSKCHLYDKWGHWRWVRTDLLFAVSEHLSINTNVQKIQLHIQIQMLHGIFLCEKWVSKEHFILICVYIWKHDNIIFQN